MTSMSIQNSNLELLVRQLKRYYEEDERRAILDARSNLQRQLNKVSRCEVGIDYQTDGTYCLRIRCLDSEFAIVRKSIPKSLGDFPVFLEQSEMQYYVG